MHDIDSDDMKECFSMAELKDVGFDVCWENMKAIHAAAAVMVLQPKKKKKKQPAPDQDVVEAECLRILGAEGRDAAINYFYDQFPDKIMLPDFLTKSSPEVEQGSALTIKTAKVLFGVPGATRVEEFAITAIYRALSKALHPDRGGNAEDMAQLNKARVLLLEAL